MDIPIGRGCKCKCKFECGEYEKREYFASQKCNKIFSSLYANNCLPLPFINGVTTTYAFPKAVYTAGEIFVQKSFRSEYPCFSVLVSSRYRYQFVNVSRSFDGTNLKSSITHRISLKVNANSLRNY